MGAKVLNQKMSVAIPELWQGAKELVQPKQRQHQGCAGEPKCSTNKSSNGNTRAVQGSQSAQAATPARPEQADWQRQPGQDLKCLAKGAGAAVPAAYGSQSARPRCTQEPKCSPEKKSVAQPSGTDGSKGTQPNKSAAAQGRASANPCKRGQPQRQWHELTQKA